MSSQTTVVLYLGGCRLEKTADLVAVTEYREWD